MILFGFASIKEWTTSQSTSEALSSSISTTTTITTSRSTNTTSPVYYTTYYAENTFYSQSTTTTWQVSSSTTISQDLGYNAVYVYYRVLKPAHAQYPRSEIKNYATYRYVNQTVFGFTSGEYTYASGGLQADNTTDNYYSLLRSYQQTINYNTSKSTTTQWYQSTSKSRSTYYYPSFTTQWDVVVPNNYTTNWTTNYSVERTTSFYV